MIAKTETKRTLHALGCIQQRTDDFLHRLPECRLGASEFQREGVDESSDLGLMVVSKGNAVSDGNNQDGQTLRSRGKGDEDVASSKIKNKRFSIETEP